MERLHGWLNFTLAVVFFCLFVYEYLTILFCLRAHISDKAFILANTPHSSSPWCVTPSLPLCPPRTFLSFPLALSPCRHLLLFCSFTLLPGDSHCHLSPDGQRSVTVLGHTDQSPLSLSLPLSHTHTHIHISNFNLSEYIEELALSVTIMKKSLFISSQTTPLPFLLFNMSKLFKGYLSLMLWPQWNCPH